MKIIKESHIHEINERQLAFVVDALKDRTGAFVVAVELPPELGTLPCKLYGPIVGDAPVLDTDHDLVVGVRGTRQYTSRMIRRTERPSRFATVIAGEHDGEPCVLFTVFGGPIAPREPGDPSLGDDVRAHAESKAFWAEHALAFDPFTDTLAKGA